jgi:tryptophan synthase alpha chain
MLNRIDTTFARLKTDHQAGFVAYVTGGDPHRDATVEISCALAASGVDVLELGVPFSDPLADGATIQAAAARALAAGTNVANLLESLREIRRRCPDLAIVLFTYLNPIYTFGFERFHVEAAAAGADGVLILDLPPDEAARNAELSGTHGLKAIRLIAPTTPPARMARIAASADGFIYYVSREGVTGEQTELSDTISSQVAELRRHTDLPIAVGFGISNPEQAASVAQHADAVVVGSAIVRRIAEHADDPDLAGKIAAFVRPLAEATHRVKRP